MDDNKASFPMVTAGKKKYMKQNDKKTRAVTLTELLVMMAVMVILLGIAAPVAQKLAQLLGNSAGARNIIDAAMASARAIAVSEGQYAGVRFQQDSNGRQYLIFIIHEEPAKMGWIADGFRVVEGRKPTALPEGLGTVAGGNYQDSVLSTTPEMTNATTFSVVFDPSGKFVIHSVRVRNKDGKIDSDSPASTDKVFNVKTQVDSGNAILIQDDYSTLGLAEENSVPSFIIYEQSKLAQVAAAKRWSGYLSKLSMEYINPYTGELVKKN
jgi:Tfp pilus assembly protein FimT